MPSTETVTEEVADKVVEETTTEDPSILDISDEEFEASFDKAPDAETTTKKPDPAEDEPSTEKPAEAEEEAVSTVEGEVEDGTETEPKEETAAEEEKEENVSAEDTKKEEGETATAEDDKKEETSTEDNKTPDYKAEYERILAPFKANNKEIQVDSIDDAITLMRMGANYNKKMQAIKPNLRLMKMLENNGLLDEGRISRLIDLNKGDKAAISALMREKGMDPMEMDTQQDSEYTPSTYTVDDTELELDAALDEIKESPAFQDTLDVVRNKWDASSREALVKQPKVITVLNEHIETGVFDKITTVVDRERMLGRLSDMNDVQAYHYVGEMLNKQGAFDAPEAEATTTTPTQQDKPAETTSTSEKAAKEAERDSRRKAASATKSVVQGEDVDYNPLSMSDEEFEKLGNKYV